MAQASWSKVGGLGGCLGEILGLLGQVRLAKCSWLRRVLGRVVRWAHGFCVIVPTIASLLAEIDEF